MENKLLDFRENMDFTIDAFRSGEYDSRKWVAIIENKTLSGININVPALTVDELREIIYYIDTL